MESSTVTSFRLDMEETATGAGNDAGDLDRFRPGQHRTRTGASEFRGRQERKASRTGGRDDSVAEAPTGRKPTTHHPRKSRDCSPTRPRGQWSHLSRKLSQALAKWEKWPLAGVGDQGQVCEEWGSGCNSRKLRSGPPGSVAGCEPSHPLAVLPTGPRFFEDEEGPPRRLSNKSGNRELS